MGGFNTQPLGINVEQVEGVPTAMTYAAALTREIVRSIEAEAAERDRHHHQRVAAFSDSQREQHATLAAFVAWLGERDHRIATTGYLETMDDAYCVAEAIDAEAVAHLIAEFVEERGDE